MCLFSQSPTFLFSCSLPFLERFLPTSQGLLVKDPELILLFLMWQHTEASLLPPSSLIFKVLLKMLQTELLRKLCGHSKEESIKDCPLSHRCFPLHPMYSALYFSTHFFSHSFLWAFIPAIPVPLLHLRRRTDVHSLSLFLCRGLSFLKACGSFFLLPGHCHLRGACPAHLT